VPETVSCLIRRHFGPVDGPWHRVALVTGGPVFALVKGHDRVSGTHRLTARFGASRRGISTSAGRLPLTAKLTAKPVNVSGPWCTAVDTDPRVSGPGEPR